MRSVFYPHLVGGAQGDPALYVRVAYRREALLFDCGSLAGLSPRALAKVRYLFVSHTHVDHFIDFDCLVRAFLYTDHHLALFGPAGLIDQVGHRLASYTWNLVDGFPFIITVNEWDGVTLRTTRFRARNAFRPDETAATDCPDGCLLKTASYRVSATPLDHGGITSLAYALEEPLHIAIHKDALDRLGFSPGPWLTTFKDTLRSGKAAGVALEVPLAAGGTRTIPIERLRQEIAHTEPGMKICYVTDASPTPENLQRIEDLARDAHCLAIETPFAHADLDRAQLRNHLTARIAGEVARRAGVKRCHFFHFSPRYPDAGSALRTEAEMAFCGDATVTGDPEEPPD